MKELIKANRSYRRFYQDVKIEEDMLIDLVDLARLSPSGANLQPLKFFISNDLETNEKIFPHLSWAGYLKDWKGPIDGEKPSAYIVVLLDKTIAENILCDQGIAAQSIMLGAAERGLGGCIIASIKKDQLKQAINISNQFEIMLVLALGHPLEKVILEEVKEEGNIEYWRDQEQIHHVPKRKLESLIVKC